MNAVSTRVECNVEIPHITVASAPSPAPVEILFLADGKKAELLMCGEPVVCCSRDNSNRLNPNGALSFS